MRLKPAVYFDRDGIVNRSPGPGYVERWEDFHLLPEFIAALRVVQERGYAAVVVTNQKGVGTGKMAMAALENIHANLLRELAQQGVPLLDIYSCTATDDAHPHRKPNPGMLLEAAREHHLDLSKSWMIGDQEKDVLAGHRAGCKTVLVGHTDRPSKADFRLASVEELAPFLAAHLERVKEERPA